MSVVVPFFNPGPTVLVGTIEEVGRVLDEAGVSFEIIAVSDGSTDSSEASLRGVLSERLVLIAYTPNRGKGHAVRLGMERARGRLIGFIDADGDIDPSVLADMVAAADESGADVLFGSKVHAGSQVDAPLLRRIGSSAFRAMVRLLFGLWVPDTQTGVKLFPADLAAQVLPDMREDRFVFDLELFLLARDLGRTRFIEMPVRVAKRYASTVSAREARNIVWDTMKLFLRLKVRPRQSPTI
ncbi:MAG: glycosyltransferase family 2 protein [Acidimicrobiales bacterium]